MADHTKSRIESKLEVLSYLQNLKYALDNGAILTFQENRRVDQNRPIRFTNRYTVGKLFPHENPADALRRELKTLTVEEYLRTTEDTRFKKRGEMREFGKIYKGTEEVYIKIRVTLFGQNGKHSAFVMSFHYAETPFNQETFPYREK